MKLNAYLTTNEKLLKVIPNYNACIEMGLRV
jgi:hypothetical protein